VAEQLRRRYNQKVTNIVCRLKDVAMESNLELNLIVGLVDVMRQHNLPIGPDIQEEIEVSSFSSLPRKAYSRLAH
jgi:hypothetical protein